MQTIPKITVRKDDSIAFAQMLRDAKAFDTHGNLYARRELLGLGEYTPYDAIELDEMMAALYVVYSYETPIAWLTKSNVWVKNINYYSATTKNHQNKVFSAISLLR